MKFMKLFITTWLVVSCGLRSPVTHAQDEFPSNYFHTSDGVKLHYLETGSGQTLVFVPGWTMPAEIWEHQLRHFASTHRVIALDPRGQGRSEKVSFGYQPSRRALDIGELLEHIGGEPAIVVGWSLAMQEVLVLAHEYGTQDMRAVILVDYAVDIDTAGLTSRFVSMQTERESWIRNFVSAMYRSPQSDEYLEAITQASLSTPANATAIMIANLILMGPTALGPALDSLDRPALFIASSQGWAVEQAELIREGWPEIQVEVIEDTEHALFADRPVEFNRIVEEFVASLPEA